MKRRRVPFFFSYSKFSVQLYSVHWSVQDLDLKLSTTLLFLKNSTVQLSTNYQLDSISDFIHCSTFVRYNSRTKISEFQLGIPTQLDFICAQFRPIPRSGIPSGNPSISPRRNLYNLTIKRFNFRTRMLWVRGSNTRCWYPTRKPFLKFTVFFFINH